ncbi:hypothetical protein [Phenylobacterium ferrooxidans]|uniref:Uncharacterized protein n=1 Tax=Phenylobacterium ferrooxidans TaxID=2982689 RepID=A0ABW6CN90_9CAUL
MEVVHTITSCSGVAEPVQVLRDHLFTADTAITNAGSAGPFCIADPTDLAMRSGAAVLRLSEGASDWRFEHVLVAWKDCRRMAKRWPKRL